MIKQFFIFFLLHKENKNSENDSNDSDNLREPRDSDDDVTVDVDHFFLRTTKTIMHVSMIQMIFL